MKKSPASLIFLFWTGILVTVFYVVQKPNLSALAGLTNTIQTLLVALLLLFNAYGIGRRVIKLTTPEHLETIEHLLLSVGFGLGGLGLLGLGFSAAQLANTTALAVFQIALGILFVITQDAKKLYDELHALSNYWKASFSQFNPFTKLAVFLPFAFSFLLALLPPFEAFDALSYHLAQPAKILHDGGLRAVDVPAFWYPNITDNVYLWALALHSDRAAQILHFAWAVSSILLLWYWAVKIWGVEIGRKTLLLVASMASLPLISSWAYADMALVFFASVAIISLTQYKSTNTTSWLTISAISAGFAMSVKYTSIAVPITCGILLLTERPTGQAIKSALRFSFIALLIALPWYLRNAIIMHNPFYPFVFNGLYWNSFRAEWYSNAGTGIGWDPIQLLLIPINMALGFRENSPIDGRIGPLLLILLPCTIWILFKHPRRNLTETWFLRAIALFASLSLAAWVFGVINSAVLWQTRLLLPTLLPLTIPTAIGWGVLSQLDTPKFRISFLFNTIASLVIVLALFDSLNFVIQRNPFAVAIGIQSRERYIQRVNSSYFELMQLMDTLPSNANIYSLYEPRSYALPRSTQPDLGLYNFANDLYFQRSADNMIQFWKASGYSHILIYERGVRLAFEDDQEDINKTRFDALNKIRNSLELIGQTPDGVYSIYAIR